MQVAEPGWFPDTADARLLRWWDGSAWTGQVTPAPQADVVGFGVAPSPNPSLRPQPAPRLIRSPTDAEEVAAEWMRWYGFTDAVATQASQDGGIDVDSSRAVAQVKAYMVPIGRPALQQLYGAAAPMGKATLFFALTGYTREALDWGNAVGMALFRFDTGGGVEPVNDHGRRVAGGGGQSPSAPAVHRPAPPQPRVPAFMRFQSDSYYVAAAQRARQGAFTKEQLLWVVRTWVPLIAIRVDYTMRQRKRETHNSGTCLFEPLDGRLYRPPVSQRVGAVSANTLTVGARVSADQITKLVLKEYGIRNRVKTPEARQRHDRELQAMGVPGSAASISLVPIEGPLLPISVACYRSRAGDRSVVWDGSTGAVSEPLSRSLTQNLGWASQHALQVGQRLA